MGQNEGELEPASEDMEAFAKGFFPYQNVTAEEYAAREAHRFGAFSLGYYAYRNLEFNNWIHDFTQILNTPERLEQVRRKYLTDEEYRLVEQEQNF